MEDKIKELENLGKPIIHCNQIIYYFCKNYTVINYESKNFIQKYLTKTIEEKDGILITDDFIFIKD